MPVNIKYIIITIVTSVTAVCLNPLFCSIVNDFFVRSLLVGRTALNQVPVFTMTTSHVKLHLLHYSARVSLTCHMMSKSVGSSRLGTFVFSVNNEWLSHSLQAPVSNEQRSMRFKNTSVTHVEKPTEWFPFCA